MLVRVWFTKKLMGLIEPLKVNKIENFMGCEDWSLEERSYVL